MPNKARASFEITLNGAEYTLRPTFESMMEFEDKSGVDAFEALSKFIPKEGAKKEDFFKNIKTRLIVSCIWAGIKGEAIFQKSECPSFEEIGRECQAHGIAACSTFAMDYLGRAVASDENTKK